MLAEVKHGCPAWFGLLYPLSLLDTKEVLAALKRGDSTKIPGTELSRWELICSEFYGVLKPPGTPIRLHLKGYNF